MWPDFQHAVRLARKNPLFTIAAVLTLALGIGGNTAIFTVINTVLLKPLEYRDPDRLVQISIDDTKRGLSNMAMSLLRFDETRAAQRSFQEIGGFVVENYALSSQNPEQVAGARVSANFLRILGVTPEIGRSFTDAEGVPGGPPVAMISDRLWRRRFGGSAQVLGSAAILDSTPHTIIGVLPPGFQFPLPDLDMWVTRISQTSLMSPAQVQNGAGYIIGFARLRDGVSIEQAAAELTVLGRQYSKAHPASADGDPSAGMSVLALRDQLVSNVRPTLWVLFGAVGFVLLIACANVASLLLARAASRSREFAVRAALGASRGRIIRQLLAESVLLAIFGGVLGALLAAWGLRAFTALNANSLPRAAEIRVDGLVLLFTLGISILTGILFGLFPALQISRPDLADVLRERGAGVGAARGKILGVNVRSLLVVGQVALSIVLLIGAALLIESLQRLRQVDPGFQPSNLLTAQISLLPGRYDTNRKKATFFEDITQRLAATPGIRDAAVTLTLPSTFGFLFPIQIDGRPSLRMGERPLGQVQSITLDFFRTMGIPLRRGRTFTGRDTEGAPFVVMINESMARRFWKEYPRGQDPVGQHMLLGPNNNVRAEIIGIAGDVREGGLGADAGPEMYISCAQRSLQTVYLIVRTKGDPKQLVNTMRQQVASVDPDQPLALVRTMDEVLEASLLQRRLTLLLLTVFASLALLLAAVGLYGVIAYSVAQRTQEVGIRRALGAQHGDILRLVVGQGLRLTLAGIALGVGGALLLTKAISGMLFHVSATDPITFAGISILFVAVALVASYLPARRAARIDPMTALRT